MERFSLKNENGVVIAEAENGQEIGYGFVTLEKRKVVLDGLLVYPDFRGLGVGSAIMGTIIEAARCTKANKITGKFNPEDGMEEIVKDFYHKHGFKIVGRNKLVCCL